MFNLETIHRTPDTAIRSLTLTFNHTSRLQTNPESSSISNLI